MKILVVEDEYVLRVTLAEVFQSNGHQAYTAMDGFEGLSLFEQVRPDVVVTDLGMPGMSGIELIRKLRTVAPEAPIVVLTAIADGNTKANAEKAGASMFLTKPVSATNLVEILETKYGQPSQGSDGGIEAD